MTVAPETKPVTPPMASIRSSPAPVELTVVVPTFNERENIVPLVDRLETALAGLSWEAIFVDDDSPDGTADEIRTLAQSRSHVRCLQRLNRRGLSSACVEGILASTAPYVAVMDADLQHDEALLPEMLAKVKSEGLDLVVASRYAEGGGVGDWDRSRVALSSIAGRLARLVVKADLSDPMSGFFLIERGAFAGAMRHLSAQGFKILLDLFASSPRPFRFGECTYQFRQRLHGESKLDTLVAWEYLMLLLDKLVGHLVPVRFFLFALIGTLGIATHLATLWLTTQVLAFDFALAQTIATVTAMTGNYWLNNLFTYRDRRLKGWRFLTGLVSFYAICGLGAAANVGIASYIFRNDHAWWLAGIAGAVVGSVWNYAVSSIFTWRSR